MKNIRRLTAYLGPYKKDMILGIVLVMAETALELFIPVMITDLIDVGVASHDIAYIYKKGFEMGGLALLALITGLLYARYAARAANGWGAELRKAEYERVQMYGFSSLDQFSTSSLITRMTTDVTVLQNLIGAGFRPMMRGPALLVMGVALSFWMNARLSLVFLVCLPVLAVLLFLIVRKVGPMYAKLQGTVDHLNNVVQEGLTAIRAVKAFVRDEYEEEKFGEVNSALMETSQTTFHYAVLNLPAFQAVMYAAIVLMMWYGGDMILHGSLKVGELTGLLSYVMQVMNSLMMIANVFLMLTRSLASAQRVCEVLDEPEELQAAEGMSAEAQPTKAQVAGAQPTESQMAEAQLIEAQMTGTQPAEAQSAKAHLAEAGSSIAPLREVSDGSIDFEHVSFKYRKEAKEYALSDVTLHIPAGQTVGILGGTGSSKTTLVQLIPRLYDASAGAVRVGGHDVREYDLHVLRAAAAIVLQKNVLFSGTVRDNLRWGNPEADDAAIWAACREACADEFLEKLPQGLDTVLSQGASNLSGGQKQRLCIARALLSNAKILIFDDSTSAVDTATEGKIQAALKRRTGVTKIIIAQRITSVMHTDQIIILDDGHVHAVGTHTELLAHDPIYQEIYASQQKGGDGDGVEAVQCEKA